VVVVDLSGLKDLGGLINFGIKRLAAQPKALEQALDSRLSKQLTAESGVSSLR